jgi:uncharacterized protein (DUF427 family)
MSKAIWNGVTLAETNTAAHVEGNIYFPIGTVNWNYLHPNPEVPVTFCHWKGFAGYFDVIVGGEKNTGAAWRYEEPYEEASLIKNHIAFWKGVEVINAPKGSGFVEPSPSLRGSKSGWEALCWLIRHSKKSTLNADDVFKNTNITDAAFNSAWEMPDVRRYAKRYRWTLKNRIPLILERSDGNPTDVF